MSAGGPSARPQAGGRSRRPRGPFPVRELVEGCVLVVGLDLVLVQLHAAGPVAVLGTLLALAWAAAWPFRTWDAPPRRLVVMLARVATVWFVLPAVPILYLSIVDLILGGGGLVLLWVVLGLPASLAGTAKLRERHDVFGVLLKLFALGPLTLSLAAMGRPGTFAAVVACFGWITLTLIVALGVAAFFAWRHDPIDPSESWTRRPT